MATRSNFVDVLDRIRNTSVFCYALVCEVDFAVSVNSNVFKESVTTDCTVDIRFAFFVKVDNFCVATTFEVEDAIIVPTVFVVTDEETFRVCRKSCFTCT